MEIGFPLVVGERFKDGDDNVVTFQDYYAGTIFLLLVEPGIEFSQPFDDFYQQYMLGIIREVCDVPKVV
jgi:hypothetical protein